MRARWALLALLLAVLLVALCVVAIEVGVAQTTTEIIWSIRAPRVAMALVVGSGLALAGVLMQGSLGNPLADPGIVGVSAGAAFGAVVAVGLGAAFNTPMTSVAACLGAAAATAVVVAVSLHDRRPEVVTLLLAGVAVTAFCGAVLAMIVSMSASAAVRSITFWSSGSLALSTWGAVWAVAPFVVAGAAVAMTTARSLDVLSLGDRAASSAGVDVAAVRYRALAAVVLLVAAGVASVGIIAFVGLLIPHAMRMIIGPRHGRLLVVSALAGALLILAADTLARLVANPIEIPIGAITAVIGAPVFFILLRHTRARQGGWA
ncbi:MAG: iron ABC transporter permease [Actinobacteria bacterium]|nr:iron ABC transporter permease [Actinomycetota bacterium]